MDNLPYGTLLASMLAVSVAGCRLENPSCRWSTWDALRNEWELPKGVAASIQERAWSSPIWFPP